METVCWKQRFENYDRTLKRLEQAIAAHEHATEPHLIEMAIIQAFEFSFELGWKVLKDYLKHQGVTAISLPREVIRQAFHHQVIVDGQGWIDMMEARNQTSHTYDDAKAAAIVDQIRSRFLALLQQLYVDLNERRTTS